MSAAILGFFLGCFIGSVTMAMIAVAGQQDSCDECRRRREPKEGGGYHIGSHKELF